VGELKGRRPVVRGSATLRVDPGQLRNPSSSVHLTGRASGSRSAATVVTADLAYLRGNAVNTGLAFEACGGVGWRHAVWGVPGGVAIYYILQYSAFGAVPERWFSQVDPASPGLHRRYRWSVRLVRWASLLAGVPLPGPEYVSLDHPLPIAKWMTGVLRAEGRPHLHTFLSSAVRLCQAALAAGLDLRGSVFTVTGEPITEAGLEVIQRAGGKALPRYASAECGPIGLACLAPEAPDEVHLLHDRLAMIQSGADGQGAALPSSALLVSSLRARAPLILLNVSLGDRAVMVQRACGCSMECFGWTTHLHTIRSYDKLTAGGMTFLDTDVIQVLEEVLPARFGGGPNRLPAPGGTGR
jgi:hypothetical protein